MDVGSSLFLLGSSAVAVWFIFVRRATGGPANFLHRKTGKADPAAGYGLKTASLPPVTGFPLKILTTVLNSVFGTQVLIPNAYKNSNGDLLRKIVIPEDPTMYPIMPFDGPSIPLGSKSSTDLTDLTRPSSETMTPTEVAERAIRAIQDSDRRKPPLRAIIQYNVEEIRKMAAASTERYRNNAPLSPLDGVPVCIKEELAVVPYYHRSGTDCLGCDAPSTVDSTVVAKLREAGAVILGVANMHELGMGVTGCNPNKLHGTARNPYNPQHFTGGSSSGSASAVGAGICPIAIGTDAGGSVRIPSALCGVVGLKGPIAASVRDAAIAFALTAGPDPKYPHGLNQPIIDLENLDNTNLTGIRVGVDWRYLRHSSNCIVAACEKTIEHLENCGANIVDVQIPELEEARIAHTCIVVMEMAAAMAESFSKQYDNLTLPSRGLLAMRDTVPAFDYIQAMKQRTRTMNFLKEIFNKVDVIITPGTGVLAPRTNPGELTYGKAPDQKDSALMRYMFLGNLAGIPAVTVPIGYSSNNNLPMSLQVQAGWWQEGVMLRVAHAVEKGTKHAKPQVHFSLLG
uniref:Amidase domain-containing protein n=1 Tax=Branchiostoma floridae TaxID=7739 RepID=C3ZM55_BRAFL|eukprot:XP_002590300.1 hypothetical protein BRAFLDRAFT_121360 [Branchiostoma floridae]